MLHGLDIGVALVEGAIFVWRCVRFRRSTRAKQQAADFPVPCEYGGTTHQVASLQNSVPVQYRRDAGTLDQAVPEDARSRAVCWWWVIGHT